MNDYLLDPNVCPSSLNENDEPVDPNETAHKWDDTTNPITCAECGTLKTEDNETCPDCFGTNGLHLRASCAE
jgi:hypothetical protein